MTVNTILIICTCIFTFCAGVILGGAIHRDAVRVVDFNRPAVEAEDIPDQGETYVYVIVPEHKHPITAALMFDGDEMAIFKEARRI